MSKILSALALALAAGLCLAAPLRAQDAVLEQMYGTGVHHYFSNNFPQAVADLTDAVNAGTRDPRVFYFRGVAEQRMGMGAAAEADLLRGAELESADVNQFYPVSKSLERVQGSVRLTLER